MFVAVSHNPLLIKSLSQNFSLIWGNFNKTWQISFKNDWSSSVKNHISIKNLFSSKHLCPLFAFLNVFMTFSSSLIFFFVRRKENIWRCSFETFSLNLTGIFVIDFGNFKQIYSNDVMTFCLCELLLVGWMDGLLAVV